MRGVFAVGVPGQPVRMVLQAEKADALAQCRDGEVCCLLTSVPPGPVMITQDGQDVVDVPVPLEVLKAARWAEAKAIRDARMGGGCLVSTDGGQVGIDTNEDARAKLNGLATGAMIAASLGTPLSVPWTMADNSVVSLDGPSILRVSMQVLAHVNACQVAGTAIRDAIEAAQDAAALQAIDIASGYPALV